jgi:hypothetical protein
MSTTGSFLRKLPEHKCELCLTHNQHRSYYQTVKQFCEERISQGSLHEEDCVSFEQREKAFATNELWELQWYPETPIGSFRILSCDLEALLEETGKGD